MARLSNIGSRSGSWHSSSGIQPSDFAALVSRALTFVGAFGQAWCKQQIFISGALSCLSQFFFSCFCSFVRSFVAICSLPTTIVVGHEKPCSSTRQSVLSVAHCNPKDTNLNVNLDAASYVDANQFLSLFASPCLCPFQFLQCWNGIAPWLASHTCPSDRL